MVEINCLLFFLLGSFLTLIGFKAYKEISDIFLEYKKEEEREGRQWFKRMVKTYGYSLNNLDNIVRSFLDIYPKDKEWVEREAKREKRRLKRRLKACGIRTTS